MINEKQTTIQISRGKFIEESRSIAILRLNTKEFKKGEVVMMNYYKDKDFRNNVGVLIAIGVDNGIGEEFYRLVSAGGTVTVRKVTDSIPDVSSLVHNELYIYKSQEDKWMYVYKKDSENDRTEELITGGPYIFVDLDSGYRWFYNNQDCKREDEFLSTTVSEKILQSILDTDLKLNVSSDSGYIFKAGTIQDITLSIKTLNGTNDVSKDCLYYLDGEQIELSADNKYTLENRVQDSDHTVESRYEIYPGIRYPVKSTVKIRFGYIFYCGRVKEGWYPTVEEIQKLEKTSLSYRRDFKWDNIVLDSESIVFSYPKKYGYISHIYDDNGLDYIHNYLCYDNKYTINNEDYLVYIKSDIVSIDDFMQTWVFDDPDSLDAEEDNILDLVNAWKDQNKSGGVVVVDSSGKIPTSLYDLNKTDSFKHLAGIVSDYPTSGMTKDNLYYNSTTKKIYKAVSDSVGIISDPEQAEVYTYDNKFYAWTGLSLQPFSYMGSRVINNITEIFN